MKVSSSLQQSSKSLIASDLKTDFRRWMVIETNSNFHASRFRVKAFFYPSNKMLPGIKNMQNLLEVSVLHQKGTAQDSMSFGTLGTEQVVWNTGNRASDHRDGNTFDTCHPAPRASTNHNPAFNITPLAVLQSNQRVPNQVSIAWNALINFLQQLTDAKEERKTALFHPVPI